MEGKIEITKNTIIMHYLPTLIISSILLLYGIIATFIPVLDLASDMTSFTVLLVTGLIAIFIGVWILSVNITVIRHIEYGYSISYTFTMKSIIFAKYVNNSLRTNYELPYKNIKKFSVGVKLIFVFDMDDNCLPVEKNNENLLMLKKNVKKVQ